MIFFALILLLLLVNQMRFGKLQWIFNLLLIKWPADVKKIRIPVREKRTGAYGPW
jgi:hypothetical protein